ncbi:MAG: type IV pilus modification PilV family protein [Patescibacteria group bacterium]
MFTNSRGNSIIEVIVVMLVLTTGLTGAYGILSSGQTLAVTTENRIKAVNIAREGIEAVENIRSTNWIKFSSDYNACYDTADYNPLCIGNTNPARPYSLKSGSYIMTGNSGGAWSLSGVTSPGSYTGATRPQYLAVFPIYLDSNGLLSQKGPPPSLKCTNTISRNCVSIFTREIRITRPADYSNIQIESIVTWKDGTRDEPYSITLNHTLTNWKYNYYQK